MDGLFRVAAAVVLVWGALYVAVSILAAVIGAVL